MQIQFYMLVPINTCFINCLLTYLHTLGGWCRWAMVSPDGVAPSRMVSVPVSVNLPLHHKVQKFSSGTSSPRWSRKKGRKTVVVWWWLHTLKWNVKHDNVDWTCRAVSMSNRVIGWRSSRASAAVHDSWTAASRCASSTDGFMLGTWLPRADRVVELCHINHKITIGSNS